MTAIVATVFIAWLLWILVDTAITETLNPGSPRNKARSPSMRICYSRGAVRTILRICPTTRR